MNRNDGILTVYDMSSNKDYLKFYGEDKYWNMDVKEDFLNQTRSMWRGLGSKYEGRIFNIAHRANDEITLTQMKVDRELEDAINKHGVVQPPQEFEDQFRDRIN